MNLLNTTLTQVITYKIIKTSEYYPDSLHGIVSLYKFFQQAVAFLF